jgi:mycofactocin biosynthesis protein MftB
VTEDPPGAAPYDLDRPWRLNPQVAVRPEPFGALLYHFGNRRLSFLKDPELLALVQALARFPTARETARAVGITDRRLPAHHRALRTLAASDIVVPGTPAQPAVPQEEPA